MTRYQVSAQGPNGELYVILGLHCRRWFATFEAAELAAAMFQTSHPGTVTCIYGSPDTQPQELVEPL